MTRSRPGAINSKGLTVNLDGGNISDQVVSSRDALGASVEEVKEFQVLTNNYNAEYGQAGNVILNVITKSGTDAIHGDAHAYFRGRNLAASDFFFNQTACDPTLTGPGPCDNKADAGFPTSRAPFFVHRRRAVRKGSLVLVREPGAGSAGLARNTDAVRYVDHHECADHGAVVVRQGRREVIRPSIRAA